MRILVVGGAGFLGSELINELAKDRSNEIYILDAFVHGYPEKLPKRKGIRDFIVGNIKDYPTVCRAVEKAEAEVVIHLASHITRPESRGDFRNCAAVNYVGTANLLEACLRERYKPKKIIFASSESVRNPFSHHGISTLAAENLLQTTCPLVGIELFSLRFAEIYGLSKSQTSKCLINMLVDFMLMEYNIGVSGVLNEKDYIHISDAVEACKKAIEISPPYGTGGGDIGTGQGIRTKDLVEKLKSLIDFKGQFAYDIKDPSIQVIDSVSDMGRAEAQLEFSCKADFDTELKRLVSKRRKELK